MPVTKATGETFLDPQRLVRDEVCKIAVLCGYVGDKKGHEDMIGIWNLDREECQVWAEEEVGKLFSSKHG